jgi:hypothetical protein
MSKKPKPTQLREKLDKVAITLAGQLEAGSSPDKDTIDAFKALSTYCIGITRASKGEDPDAPSPFDNFRNAIQNSDNETGVQ